MKIPAPFKKWLKDQHKPFTIFVSDDGQIDCEEGLEPYVANAILGEYLEDVGDGVVSFDCKKFLKDWRE